MNISHMFQFHTKRSAVLAFSMTLLGLFVQAFAASAIAAYSDDPAASNQVKVYKYDQSTQCNQDGVSLDEMQQELTSAGVTVYCAQKSHDGLLYPAVCGGATGTINVYLIDRRDFGQALRLGFSPVSKLPEYEDSPCVSDVTSVPKVFKYDESTQCNDDGIPLNVMAEDLLEAGIDIKCSQKAHDGLFYTTVCDGATGVINVYEINPENITDAQRLGFDPVSSLSDYQDRDCSQDALTADK